MSSSGSHIPFSRVDAALRGGDLAFVRRHAARIQLGIVDALRVCVLIAEQDGPDALEAASVRWIQRFAVEAQGQRRLDYRLIVDAFDAMALDPGVSARELQALCVSRGLRLPGRD